MKRLLLCALTASLLCAPARADNDRDFLYGGATPNSAQTLNRRLTLLEHALVSVLRDNWLNDHNPNLPRRPTERTGYPPNGETMARNLLETQVGAQDFFRQNFANNRAALDGRGQTYATALRGAFRTVAQWYLEQTANGRGDPKKLTDFEANVLTSYIGKAGNDEFNRFAIHLVGTQVPTSPEDRYQLALRVSDARAFLRASLKRYVDHPPAAGEVNVTGEYTAVDESARMLLAGDATKLAPYYTDAGMTRPQRTAPARPFIQQFTDMESAALTAMTAGGAATEFDADREQADADAQKMAILVAKWKLRAKNAAQQIASYQSGGADNPYRQGAGNDARHNFEDTYLRQRLDKLNPAYWRFKQDLEQQAYRAQNNLTISVLLTDANNNNRPTELPDPGSGVDATAQKRLQDKFRLMSYNDIKDLARNGSQARGEALNAWARANLVSGKKYDDSQLAGPNPHPQRPRPENANNNNNPVDPNADVTDDELAAGLANAENPFSPLEILIIKKIASREDRRAIAHHTSTKDWHREALDKARLTTSNPVPNEVADLRSYLTSNGVSNPDFGAYVCQGIDPGSVGASNGNTALTQLQSGAVQSNAAANNGNVDAARGQSDIIDGGTAVAYNGLRAFCQDYFNSLKQNPTQPQPTGTLTVNPVPPVGVTPTTRTDPQSGAFEKSKGDGGDGSKKGGKDWGDKLVDATLYGAVGWVAGALVASAMALGPFGFLALVLGGAAIGATMALKKDAKKGKKDDGDA